MPTSHCARSHSSRLPGGNVPSPADKSAERHAAFDVRQLEMLLCRRRAALAASQRCETRRCPVLDSATREKCRPQIDFAGRSSRAGSDRCEFGDFREVRYLKEF
jgi:hypothetical protein